MEEKIKNVTSHLGECIAMCNYCFNACLNEKDVKMMEKCIRLDKECASICTITLASIASDGPFKRELLHLCIQACENCAEECRKYSHQHCQDCAKYCHECAEACRSFA